MKTAEELKVTEIERDALAEVLRRMVAGQIDNDGLDMAQFRSDCGTVCCLCGWANAVDPRAFPEVESLPGAFRSSALIKRLSPAAVRLFALGDGLDQLNVRCHATVAHAIVALTTFLETGEPVWDVWDEELPR